MMGKMTSFYLDLSEHDIQITAMEYQLISFMYYVKCTFINIYLEFGLGIRSIYVAS